MRRIKPIGILIESAFRIAAVVVLSTLCCIGGNVFAAETPLKDRDISDAVENAFRKDTAVPSFRIEITTTDGIVILKGSVDNILAKERAARVAEVVKGVRAVVNKIEVAWPVLRTDRRMQEDVTDALIEDPAAEVSDIHIQVKDGIAILSGIADTWQEKRLYGRVAKGVKGVRKVDNRIVPVWPESRMDREIHAEVEEVLAWDALVDHALIDVAVENGKVTLSGVVGSAAEKRRASVNAYVHGVKSVDNSGLKVERWARDPDLRKEKYIEKTEEEIEKAVKAALHYIYNPLVDDR